MIGNKIVDTINRLSKTFRKNNSVTVINDTENMGIDRDIPAKNMSLFSKKAASY